MTEVEVAKQMDIVDAITSSSPGCLQTLIDQGYDINRPLSLGSMYGFNSSTASANFTPSSEEIVAWDTSRTQLRMAYPIHLAIITLFKAIVNFDSISRDQSLQTICMLFRNGADWKSECNGIMILNMKKFKWLSFPENVARNQPMHLAMFLKKYLDGCNGTKIDEVIDIIQKVAKKEIDKRAIANAKPTSLKTTKVLKSVANTYKGILFSEDFSDVTFECSDGVSVPAHKNILAASSPYFKTAFQGNWAENNADGIWRTSHSSSLIKSVLTLIYTGSVEECQSLLAENESNPLGLLNLACEYDIKPLVLISVDNCIKHIKFDNVRVMLQTAHVHSCKELKKSCFEYIKANATKALMSPDMMCLATEDPELWAELGTFLNGKRPRSDE